MKAVINFKDKRAYVQAKSILDAGWLGFNFADEYHDLVRSGWQLYYYAVGDEAHFRDDDPVIEVANLPALVRAIRASPPKSCCHSCCRGAETALPRTGDADD